jgi:vancomycin permeability regulator SanA
MARALYLGREAGLHVSGLTADLHSYGYQGKKSDVRELFARVKAVKDAVIHPGVLLGPQIPITGDGRLSWGPQRPPAG